MRDKRALAPLYGLLSDMLVSWYSYKNILIMISTQDHKLSFLLPDQEGDAKKSEKLSFTNFVEHFDDHLETVQSYHKRKQTNEGY